MTLLSFLSFKGSPGVTTTVLGLAANWPRAVVALDLDPQGGDMLVGLGGGRVSAAHGIVDVLADARWSDFSGALGRHMVRPAEHGPLMLTGFGSPRASSAVDWQRTADQLRAFQGADLLVDCGRVTPGHPIGAVLAQSAVVVVVTRSHLASVRHVARSAALLGDDVAPGQLRLVVVGAGQPYSADEISQACGISLGAVLPDDPAGALIWSDGHEPGPRVRRSKLDRALNAAAATQLVPATAAGGRR